MEGQTEGKRLGRKLKGMIVELMENKRYGAVFFFVKKIGAGTDFFFNPDGLTLTLLSVSIYSPVLFALPKRFS